MERKLAAILAADIVGYSRLMGIDEERTLEALRCLRTDVIEPAFARRNGRIVKLMGDGLLGEFSSVVDAVSAALEIQHETLKRGESAPSDQRISLRVGVNIGDVVVEDDDIFGDGVNIAARLQELSPPNGVAVSEAVHRELRGKLDVLFEDVGPQRFKNIAEPVQTWLWPLSENEQSSESANLLVFDPFVIDLDAGIIRVDGEPVHVEPQVFDLVSLLCANPGRLLGHDEIIEKIWNGRIISDSAIASRINAARKALGDDGQRQEIIKTVRGRGFRFELTPARKSNIASRRDSYDRLSNKFVLSSTPHGYSLMMATRSGTKGSEHYKALPVFLAEAAAANNGLTMATNLAVFDRGADALRCAATLNQLIESRCKSLPQTERWCAKIGIGFGTVQHGYAHALAGRMDAVAEPGGICVTKRTLDVLDDEFSVEVAPLAEGEESDDSSPYKVTRIGDWTVPEGGRTGPAQVANCDIPEADEVSIAVLPFHISGESDELEEIALGLRLEIHNALAQLSGVLPMAAGTAAAYSGSTSPDTAQALGLRYVLQGNIRAIGRKVRLILELYDHRRGGVSWSQSYDGSLDDGFEFQDQMTTRVVRAIDVKVLSGEQARVWHKSFSDLKATRLQYRGMRDFFKMSKESMRSARESFEHLYDMHPEVSIGATWTALCNWFDLQRGWADDREAAIAATEYWAKIAIGMEDADGQAHTALCHVHLMKHEYELAEEVGKQAVTVRPSCANANGFYAHCLYFCGSLENAIHHARLAIRFSPAYPPMFAAVLAGALHANGDQETAIAVAKEGQRINPMDLHTGLVLCSALTEASHEDEARLVAVRLLRSNPTLDVASFIDGLPFRNQKMGAQLTENCLACFESLD